MRFFALVLASLLAASLAPWPVPAAVASCSDPAERGLADAGAATLAADGGHAAAGDAIPQSGWKPSAPDASGFTSASAAVPATNCDPLGAHAGRAPPLA